MNYSLYQPEDLLKFDLNKHKGGTPPSHVRFIIAEFVEFDANTNRIILLVDIKDKSTFVYFTSGFEKTAVYFEKDWENRISFSNLKGKSVVGIHKLDFEHFAPDIVCSSLKRGEEILFNQQAPRPDKFPPGTQVYVPEYCAGIVLQKFWKLGLPRLLIQVTHSLSIKLWDEWCEDMPMVVSVAEIDVQENKIKQIGKK